MSKVAVNLALAVALLLASAVPLLAQPTPLLTPEPVEKLIAVLKSDAPHKEKADACRQLAIRGGKEAVLALAALLGDEKLSHMARYGLEPIPDPSVDDALREALGKLKGRPLVGVIGSLGVRRDAKAVEPLARLLRDADADVAQAAARSLGRIATPEAVKALEAALAAAPAANQLAMCEGLFRAAEALAAKGQRDVAVKVYDRLRGLKQAPHEVRTGALRGAILARGKDGLPLLRQSLQSKDYLLFAAAVRAAYEMPGPEATLSLIGALVKWPPADQQILLIQAIGKRADAAALPVLSALVKGGPPPLRLAAIRALAEVGNASAASLLIDVMGTGDRDLAQAAQESLAALPGKAVDAAVMAMLASSEKGQRVSALELIGRRRMSGARAALLGALADSDAEIRAAALRRLGELGGDAELPVLLNVLQAAKTPQDVSAAEEALAAICVRAPKPESFTAVLAGLLGGMGRAKPTQKCSLLRVLSAVGGADALKAVRDSVRDPDAEVHVTAIRALAAWKTPDVLPDLLALAQNATEPTDKMLGLRGYLGWAAKAELPADQRLSMCRQAAGFVEKPAEKKLLLGALGNIFSADSLELIVHYLDDTATKDEAVAAALSVTEKLLKDPNAANVAAKLTGPLEKVVQAASPDQSQRAKAALGQARRKTGNR